MSRKCDESNQIYDKQEIVLSVYSMNPAKSKILLFADNSQQEISQQLQADISLNALTEGCESELQSCPAGGAAGERPWRPLIEIATDEVVPVGLWLSGPPGSGKSTSIHSVVKKRLSLANISVSSYGQVSQGKRYLVDQLALYFSEVSSNSEPRFELCRFVDIRAPIGKFNIGLIPETWS